MTKGRKPLPTEVKRTRGTLQKCRTLENEMKVQSITGELPQPPEWMTDDGKAEWMTVTAELKASGVLAQADLSIVAMYCNEIATYIECQRQMQKAGTRVMVIKDENGKLKYAQQVPYQKIANDCVEKALKLASEFGLTPSARTRIGAIKPPENKESFFEKLMREAAADA
jgi:P27 family predicted phage terminase small subunit